MEFGGGVVVGFCFGGRRGPVSFRAVKGKGGQSALELSCSAGNGGESASGAVKGECFESALEFGGGVVAVCFCFGGRRGPVSFRAVKGKGGQSALELCSAGGCEGGMM